MTGPTISAIMPVYNGVKYLRDSIGSVVEQTRKVEELIATIGRMRR